MIIRRWLGYGCSCMVGVLAGILLILLLSNAGVRAIQSIIQAPSSQPAVTIEVQENYLNNEAGKQVNGAFSTGVDALTLTGLQIDLNPANRLDLIANFRIDLGFFSLDTNAGISNQITSENGKIVITTVGQPQIGDLTLPIDALPFNLSDTIIEAINRVNRDVIAAQLNSTLDANLAGTNLYLDAVTTGGNTLTLHLKQK